MATQRPAFGTKADTIRRLAEIVRTVRAVRLRSRIQAIIILKREVGMFTWVSAADLTEADIAELLAAADAYVAGPKGGATNGEWPCLGESVAPKEHSRLPPPF